MRLGLKNRLDFYIHLIFFRFNSYLCTDLFERCAHVCSPLRYDVYIHESSFLKKERSFFSSLEIFTWESPSISAVFCWESSRLYLNDRMLFQRGVSLLTASSKATRSKSLSVALSEHPISDSTVPPFSSSPSGTERDKTGDTASSAQDASSLLIPNFSARY